MLESHTVWLKTEVSVVHCDGDRRSLPFSSERSVSGEPRTHTEKTDVAPSSEK